ncbi:hydroxyethylthiazole kinase [Rosenbergiella gaditana]
MPTDTAMFELDAPIAQQAIAQLADHSPLIHCITNTVVQNFTANLLLAAGALPAMIIDPSECQEFAQVTDGLLLNVGTLHHQHCPTFFHAAENANRYATPWVLDPVAVGGLTLRTEFCRKLLSLNPSVIRGNASEISVLAGEATSGRGPETQLSANQALDAARQLATTIEGVVVVTGEHDLITDGHRTLKVSGGSVLATRVTGAGCALSALCAAFAALGGDRLHNVASACWMMSRAGEYAAEQAAGPGTFAVHLLDGLAQLRKMR